MKPIPSITKFFSLVVQQKRQLASNFSVSNINSANSNRISSSVICTFCGKNGHTENVCFRKVEFPNQENKSLKNNGIKKICTHYGRNCHTIETCYKKHGYPPGYKFYGSKTNQVNNIVISEPCQKKTGKKGISPHNTTISSFVRFV